MLKTEKNTKAMQQRILLAAADHHILGKRFKQGTSCGLSVDFEHGQWWITELETGAAWSVVDAEGGHAVDGFDFEQVSEGDES